jgi:hypothetical protein
MCTIAAQQDIAASGEGKDSRCRVLAMEIEHEASGCCCRALLAELRRRRDLHGDVMDLLSGL